MLAFDVSRNLENMHYNFSVEMGFEYFSNQFDVLIENQGVFALDIQLCILVMHWNSSHQNIRSLKLLKSEAWYIISLDFGDSKLWWINGVELWDMCVYNRIKQYLDSPCVKTELVIYIYLVDDLLVSNKLVNRIWVFG